MSNKKSDGDGCFILLFVLIVFAIATLNGLYNLIEMAIMTCA